MMPVSLGKKPRFIEENSRALYISAKEPEMLQTEGEKPLRGRERNFVMAE